MGSGPGALVAHAALCRGGSLRSPILYSLPNQPVGAHETARLARFFDKGFQPRRRGIRDASEEAQAVLRRIPDPDRILTRFPPSLTDEALGER